MKKVLIVFISLFIMFSFSLLWAQNEIDGKDPDDLSGYERPELSPIINTATIASDELRLTSANQKGNGLGDIEKIRKVSEIPTLKIKQPLRLRTTRDNLSITHSSMQRDYNSGKVTTPSKEQSIQGEQIFQKPVQEMKSNNNQLE